MITVEFLYYDKTACERCASTDTSVRLSLKELKEAISAAGLEICLKETRLPESKIGLSPSVLINGVDIEKLVNKNSKLKTSHCRDCCQLAGHPVNCRAFSYRGKKYSYIPKGMITEAIKIYSKKHDTGRRPAKR
ncbi:MAG: DUF2703 domain-containing protein [archaeon]